MNPKVSLIVNDQLTYPDPFDSTSDQAKIFKENFDKVLEGLGLGEKIIGSEDQNPFASFITPGDFVVLKPNLVRHIHTSGGDIFSVIVHPVIVKLILDYVFRAVGTTGKVVIGDAPLQSANFEKIVEYMQFKKFISYYKSKGYSLIIKDFRRESIVKDDSWNIFERTIINPSSDYIEVNLRRDSFLYPVRENYKKFRVTDYDIRTMQKTHNLENNKYLVHRDILKADVIINIPKLKTHKKAGITCAMKNMIGIREQRFFTSSYFCGQRKRWR